MATKMVTSVDEIHTAVQVVVSRATEMTTVKYFFMKKRTTGHGFLIEIEVKSAIDSLIHYNTLTLVNQL